jgi:hypothetical protein
MATKVPIILMQWEQADTLRAKLMLKDKETANSHCLFLKLGFEMLIVIIIMLNYYRNKSVIITDRKALKISTISKK